MGPIYNPKNKNLTTFILTKAHLQRVSLNINKKKLKYNSNISNKILKLCQEQLS